jgi:hypothetical protein
MNTVGPAAPIADAYTNICIFIYVHSALLGHAVARLVEALRYKRVRFPMVSLDFFIDIVLLAALWPWG